MSQPESYCHSCGMPTAGETGLYCEYCSDESGGLKPRSDVREGIAGWLASWAPDKSVDFGARADSYMAAMPAWNNAETAT